MTLKYAVVIVDGAAGLPIAGRGGKTCLELARTPNLDAIALASQLGMVRTVPLGFEPSSACACMSLLGYNPVRYYRGRAAIEAVNMGIPVGEREVVFRCNLVTVADGIMKDYSAGHITTKEAAELIRALETALGSERLIFYSGVSYRHILKIKDGEETLRASCTPPHDIPGQPVSGYLPKGTGSRRLRDLMRHSEAVLREHPVNQARISRGQEPATTIWLFWGSGKIPQVPPFREVYGLKAAMTSGVDLLRGLAKMMAMSILEIPGVTDGLDNDYRAQAEGAILALEDHDLVVIHVEAPDEAGHSGSAEEKITAIERVDTEIIGRLRKYSGELRLLVMPDHPTPVVVRTHIGAPVPYLLWGSGFKANGARRFTETEAQKAGIFVDEGYKIMGKLVSD